MTKLNPSKTDLSFRDKAFCYLGIYSVKRNPYADSPTQYGWRLAYRLWHPLFWVYLLALTIWGILLQAFRVVTEVTEEVRGLREYSKVIVSDKEQAD